MADSKTSYTTTVSKVKKASESSKTLSGKLNGGQFRASKHKDSWQSVNINEVVNKFAPKASSYENGGKIMFPAPRNKAKSINPMDSTCL